MPSSRIRRQNHQNLLLLKDPLVISSHQHDGAWITKSGSERESWRSSKQKRYISSTPTSYKTRIYRAALNFYHFITSDNSKFYLYISVFFSLVFILPMIPMLMFMFAEKTPSINPAIYKYLYQNANQNVSTTTPAEPKQT